MATNEKRPLSVEIKSGELIIRAGIDTVKWALEHHEESQPFNDETGDYEQKWIVTDSLEFSKEVMNAMEREEEDGTTPLILFLDQMCMAALEDGGAGVDEAPKGTKGLDC